MQKFWGRQKNFVSREISKLYNPRKRKRNDFENKPPKGEFVIIVAGV